MSFLYAQMSFFYMHKCHFYIMCFHFYTVYVSGLDIQNNLEVTSPTNVMGINALPPPTPFQNNNSNQRQFHEEYVHPCSFTDPQNGDINQIGGPPIQIIPQTQSLSFAPNQQQSSVPIQPTLAQLSLAPLGHGLGNVVPPNGFANNNFNPVTNSTNRVPQRFAGRESLVVDNDGFELLPPLPGSANVPSQPSMCIFIPSCF